MAEAAAANSEEEQRELGQTEESKSIELTTASPAAPSTPPAIGFGSAPRSPTALTHLRLLWATVPVATAVTHPLVSWLVTLCLAYHLFVHVYIGWASGDHQSFLQGFMFMSNYAGVSVAFWIQLRLMEHRTCLGAAVGIKIERRIDVDGRRGSHFQHFDSIARECHRLGPEADRRLERFCHKWERRAIGLGMLWSGYAIRNIVVRIQKGPDDTNDELVRSELGLYGFYNLAGQFLSAACILPVANFFVTSFYQLKLMTQAWQQNVVASSARDHSRGVITTDIKGKHYADCDAARDAYLYLQRAYAKYSSVWSAPIVATIFLCTQVAISNVVLLYKMTSGFSHAPITCDGCFHYGHATVWMSAAFLIITIFLVTISQINLLASRAADLFRKADVKDYDSIGGRDDWLEYLATNPLHLRIAGVVLTPSFVMNTLYPASIAFGSLLFSTLLGED